jgi:putative hemolysin
MDQTCIKVWAITHDRTNDISGASTIRMQGMANPAGKNGATQGYGTKTVDEEKMGAAYPVSGDASAESMDCNLSK